MPRISVITATLNAATILHELYQTLCNQDYKAFEWIVVDGGSRDGTVEVLIGLAAKSPWLRFISEEDCGVYDALNKGIHLARGEYYVIAGADDLFEEDALGQYDEAVSTTGADVIVAKVKMEGRISGGFSPHLGWISSARAFGGAHSIGMLFRKSLHQKYGLYSMEYALLADSFFLKTLLASPNVRFRVAEFVAGEFSSKGLTSTRQLEVLTETWLIQVRTEGSIFLQTVLFIGRIMLRWRAIRREVDLERDARSA